MARELFEFYCSGGCSGYFRARLRTNIDGDYVIVCPGCKHEHHRQIRGGRITGERHSNGKKAERIVALKSSFSKEPIMEHPKDHSFNDDHDSAVLVDGEGKRQLLWNRFMGRPQ